MSGLSEQRLAEIAARAEAASAGPWCTDDWEIYQGTPEDVPHLAKWIGETCRAGDTDGSRTDAEFIAAARTDVPLLLARIAELEAQRDRRRTRLVALQNDRMEMQGLLSPNDGTPRRVPSEIEIHERVAPAVEWLLARVAELEAERDAVRGEVADAVMCTDGECLNRHHLPKIAGLLGGVGLVDAPEAGGSRG